jgi:hypothetical protein
MNNKTLDFSNEEFSQILEKASSMVLAKYEHLDDIKGFNVSSQEEVESWFDEPLPRTGQNSFSLLAFSLFGTLATL